MYSKLGKYFFVLILSFLAYSSAFSQTMVTARHETDDQLQVEIRFDAPPSNIATDYILDGGAIGVASVFVTGNTAFLTLLAPVPVGLSSFSVRYNPTGQNINSENNRPIDCDDFQWQADNTPTPPCAPVQPINVMVFRIEAGARNSSNWDWNLVDARVVWRPGDVSVIPTQESNAVGITGGPPDNYFIVDASLSGYTYPEDNNCGFRSQWRIRYGGLGTCSSTDPNQNQTYSSHNNDDEGTGDLNLEPAILNTNLICLNDEANMRFSDASTLNCINDIDFANTSDRYVRVIYGDKSRPDAGRIPNIYVGGVQVTDDTGALINISGGGSENGYIPTYSGGTGALGTGDIIGVVEFDDPENQLPFGDLDLITTVSTPGELRDIGDRFYVTLEYWNICNLYSTGNPLNNQVSTQDFLLIIDIPPPPLPVDDAICDGDGLGGVNYGITNAPGRTAVNWFDGDPNAGGTDITASNPNGNNSLNFPVSADSNFDGNTPGVYSLWATYVVGTSNNCESDPIEVQVTVREDLSRPDAIIGTDEVCDGSNGVSFQLPNQAGNQPFGGPVEYVWSVAGGGGVTLSSNTGQNITADFNIGSSFTSVTRTIRVRRRYADVNPGCPSPIRTLDVTIYGQTQGGTTNPDNVICENDNTGIITLSGERGTILNWERSDNSGPFNDIGNAGNNSFDEVLSAAGTYEYRAVVENGVCATETSTITTITVNPIPAQPVITEVGDGLTICADGSQTILQSSNSGGDADEYQWFEDSDLINPIQGPDGNNQLVLSTPAQSGRYYVQTIGIDPTNCESPLSAPVDVVINPLPEASVVGGGAVCLGTPAPDITWTLNGTGPFDFEISTPTGTITEPNYASSTYAIVDPTDGGNYEMVSLIDNNGCSASNLGGPAVVSISATAPPTIDNFIVGAPVCDDGAATVLPTITLDLNPDASLNYDITYSLYNSANPAPAGPAIQTTTINRTTNGAGVTTIVLDYTNDFGEIPDTYEIEITSIVNTASSCDADGVPSTQFITVNPRPGNPQNPIDAVACSNDATGATLLVDDPGPGNSILWFEDMALTTPATGTTSGAGDSEFVPNSTATFTYYTITETTATGCRSLNPVAVQHTQDAAVVSNAGADETICEDSYILSATAVNPGEIGEWSGPVGVIFDDINDEATTVSNLPVGSTTLTWTVASALGVCPVDASDVIITRNALPDALDSAPELCESFPQGSNGTIIPDLTVYNDDVTGIAGSVDRTVTYFSDPGRTSVITTNYNITTATNIVYTRVTRTDVTPNCTNDGVLTFTINPLPDAIDQDATNNALETVFCEDNVGAAEFNGLDLTTLDDDVIGGGAPADRSVVWYEDPGIPVVLPSDLGALVPVSTNVPNVADGDLFYALIENTVTGCRDVAQVTITVNPRPIDNAIIAPDGTTPATYQICSSSNILFFQINGAQTPGSTYNWTLPTGAGELVFISGGTATDFFVLLQAPNPIPAPGVTLTVQEISADGCPGNTNTMDIIVDDDPPQPTITGPTEVCENQQNVVYSIAAPTGGSTYTWDIGALGSIVSGQGTSSIIVNVGVSNASISVVETNATGCQGPPAAPYPVNVNDRPMMTSANSAEICSGETVDGSLTFTSDIAGSTFDWTVVGRAGAISGTSVGNTGTGDINQTLTNTSGVTGAVTYEVIPTGPAAQNSCAGSAQIVTITVYSEPVGIDDNETVCSDENLNYDILAQNINAIGNNLVSEFTYVVSTSDPLVPAPPALDRITPSNAPISDSFTNTTGGDVFITYTITPTEVLSGNSCVGDPFDVVFRIQNEPVGLDDNDAICSGTAVNYNLQDNVTSLGNGVASTFSWLATSNTNVAGESTSPVIGNVINDVLVNQTGSDEIVTYTVTPSTTANNCAGDPFEIQITVQSEPRGLNDNVDACSNIPLSYDLQNNINTLGNGLASSFTWVAVDNPSVTGESLTVQNTSVIADNLINTSGIDQLVSYNVTPIETANGCAGSPFTISATVYSQPVGLNENISSCSNDVLSYDLQDNVDNLGNGLLSAFTWIANVDNPDVTGESLVAQNSNEIDDNLINTSGISQFVTYTVTPTETTNSCVGNSFDITVEVFSEPEGFDDALSSCSGIALNYDLQVSNLNVGGNGMNSTFTWIAADNPSVTGESTTPQSGNIIIDNIINTTAADQIVTYTVTPTDITNNCEGQPFTVTVTIQSDPLGVDDTYTNCSDLTLNYDLQNNVNALGNGVASSFVWSAVDNPDVSGESTTDQTGPIITDVLVNLTGSDENVTYTVTPTDLVNGCEGSPFTITATIQSRPAANDDAISACSDASFNYNLQANVNSLGGNGMPSTFEWIATDNPNVTGESTVVQNGAFIDDVLNNVTSVNQVVTYIVTPTSSANGCQGADFTVEVTVNPEPVGLADNSLICSRDNASYDLQDNVNSLGNTRPSTFTWVAASNPNVTGESTSIQNTNTISDILRNTSTADQNVVYTVTPTGLNGCVGNSFQVTITVQPEPVGADDNSPMACSDDPLNYDLQANLTNGVNSDFSWRATANAQVTGESQTPQVGDFINDVITNTTGTDQIVSYRVSPTGINGCAGDDFTINVTIHSEPVGLNDAAQICSQESVNYNLQLQNLDILGNGMASTFDWVAADNPNVTGESLVNQSGNILSDVLVNTTGGDQDVIYTVTPTETGNNCTGDPFTVTITISSEPVGTNSTELAQCSGELFDFDPQINVNAGNSVVSTYSWTATYDAGLTGGANNGTGNVSESLVNLTSSQLNAVYTVTPQSTVGGCPGIPFTITVPVDPEPVGSNEVFATIFCSGDGFNIDPQVNIDGNNGLVSTFTWTASYATGLNVLSAGTGTGNITETLENTTGGRLNAVYTVIPTDATTLCEGNPFNIRVRIDPEPVGTDATLAVECSDVLFNYNPQTNINDNNSITSTFVWTATYDAGLVGGAGSGTGVISESLTNVSGGQLNATYVITPTVAATGCQGQPFTVIQPIDSEPAGTNSSVAAVCSDTPFDIDPQPFINNGQVSSFTWTANYPAGLTNGAGSGSGNITETLNNSTGAQITAVYTVIPLDVNNNCFGDPFTVSVPVDPEPAGFNEVKSVVCSNVPFSFDPQNNVNAINGLPSTFTWTANYNGLVVTSAGTGTGVIAEALENTTSSRILAVYTVTPTSGGCVGENFAITVPVDPEPVGTDVTEVAVCSRDEFELDLQSYITNSIVTTFTWTAIYDAGLTGGTGSGAGDISEELINDSGAQLNATYTIIPTGIASGCSGVPFDIIVPIDPSPTAIDQTPQVCSDVPVTQVATVDLTTLEAAITGGSGDAVTWYLDEFLNAAIADPTNHSVFDAIPVFAQVDDGTCQNVAIVTYTIVPLPTVTGLITSDYNGRDVSCQGALDGEITATASGSPGPYTYELLDENENPTGITNTTGVFSGLSAGIYHISATDTSTPNNCSNNSFPIVISDPFPLSGGFVFGPQNICDGEAPVPFTEIAQPFGGIGNYAYQWEISTDDITYTDIAGATNAEYTSTALTNATGNPITYYFRRRVSSGTCADVFSNNGDPIEITVNPTPSGDFNFKDTDGNIITEICEGEPYIIEFELTPGTPPFRFDYNDGTNFFTDQFGVNPTPIIDLDGISTDLTINLTRVEDVFGCDVNLAVSKTLSVINIDPSFTLSPPAVCNGETVTFDFDVDPDVEYVWNYGDGSTETVAANSLAPGPAQVSHVYQNGNFNSSVTYPVVLTATKTIGTVCNATPVSQSVTIYANVFANVIPQNTSICSGESIFFDNQSLGASNNRWFYRRQGVSEELDVRTSPGDQTFSFTNDSGTDDPIIYEVVYTGDNGNCSDQLIIPIEVYKNPSAQFNITNVTPFVSGQGTVTLENVSTPTPPDDVFFDYNWTFGLDANPQTSTGYASPGTVTYSEPGLKQIALTVSNIAAASNGVTCESSDIQQVDILLPPITAEFTIDPVEGCSPLTVNVTSNTSQGANQFVWEVFNGAGLVVATSNEITPSFTLTTPGDYSIVLTASYPPTGQTVTSSPQFVTVFQTPTAVLEIAQQVVYIPDDGFRPLNRSQGASSFEWDFGDGNFAFIPSPEHFYDLPGEYLVTLTAINDDGCVNLDTATVRVEEGGFTKTPNAFTPSLNGPSSGLGNGGSMGASGSELNDVFLPITTGVEQFHMWIFDRWGNLIFESTDKTTGWDGYDANGRLFPAGVYVYKLELTLSNGQRTTRVGDVTLIR